MRVVDGDYATLGGRYYRVTRTPDQYGVGALDYDRFAGPVVRSSRATDGYYIVVAAQSPRFRRGPHGTTYHNWFEQVIREIQQVRSARARQIVLRNPTGCDLRPHRTGPGRRVGTHPFDTALDALPSQACPSVTADFCSGHWMGTRFPYDW